MAESRRRFARRPRHASRDNCQASFHGFVRLKPHRRRARQRVKEIVDLQIAPDAAFVQHLHGVLQFVADSLDQLAARRLIRSTRIAGDDSALRR